MGDLEHIHLAEMAHTFKTRKGNSKLAILDRFAAAFKNPILRGSTVTTDATAGARTYTIAELLGGIILRDPAGSARSDVLPTAALIIAGIPKYQIGQLFEFIVVNTADGAGEVITITGGTGATLVGTMTIPVGASRRFALRITSASTYTVYDLNANVANVPTGSVMSIADADGLSVGGIIVPQELEVPIYLPAHASAATRALFYATKGWTVTGITYEPSVAEGTGSVVCTVCKVTGSNVAVAATTPMCTAFAVTGAAGAPVVATLTGTGADLVLAATNKIGCIFSGGDSLLDTGSGIITFKMKRS